MNRLQACLLDDLFVRHSITHYVLWYYTPMALAFTGHLEPLAIIYDCMDELSAFNQAPPPMRQREAELLIYADLVFTGGQSLYEAKRTLHRHVYAFPSSVETAHFRQVRSLLADPPDQAPIPHLRLGFYGVLDERLDLALLSGIADAQPVAVINYPNDYTYTRVTEFKYLTGQEHPKTALVHEYPRAEEDLYYPVPRPENAELYKKYKALADATTSVQFVGRLATYKYYNMDHVVTQALTVFNKIVATDNAHAVEEETNEQTTCLTPTS